MASKRRERRKTERRAEMKKVGEKCKGCGKSFGRSEDEAWAMARRQLAINGGEPAKRVYECDKPRGKGNFHWTRLEVYRPESEFYSESHWL